MNNSISVYIYIIYMNTLPIDMNSISVSIYIIYINTLPIDMNSLSVSASGLLHSSPNSDIPDLQN